MRVAGVRTGAERAVDDTGGWVLAATGTVIARNAGPMTLTLGICNCDARGAVFLPPHKGAT
jgi:hypothetical protein